MLRDHSPLLAVPLLFAALLGGCDSVGETVGAAIPGAAEPPRTGSLAAAPLPSYAVGDRFVFDDGRTEEVVAVDGDQVSWKNDRGFAFTEYRNLVFPRVKWESRSAESRLDSLAYEPGSLSEVKDSLVDMFKSGRLTGASAPPPESLWPLKIGNTESFRYENTVTDKTSGAQKTYGQSWKCDVPGTETVVVPAGTFETYRIRCYRQSLTFYSYGERIWNYAPALGHYVRRTDNYYYAKASVVRNLVSASLSRAAVPPEYNAEIRAAVQRGLSTLFSGKSLSWRSADNRYAVTVTPLKTYRTSKGYFCREYSEVVTMIERTNRRQATACKMRDGQWRDL